MIRRFTFYLLILTCCSSVYMAGCSNIKGYDPGPGDNLPDSVLNVFSKAIPGAESVVFKAIEKDKLYEVNYQVNSQLYYAVLNSKKILSRYLLLNNVADSLKTLLTRFAPQSGILSDYRESFVVGNAPDWRLMQAKYRFENVDYLLEWIVYVNDKKVVINLTPYSKFDFSFDKSESSYWAIPAIHQFMDRNGWSYGDGRVYYDPMNQPRFELSGTKGMTSRQFTFSYKGDLLFSSDHEGPLFTKLEEMPAGIQSFVQNFVSLSGFRMAQGSKFSDQGKTGYALNMASNDPWQQEFRFQFDQNSNLTGTYYTGFPK